MKCTSCHQQFTRKKPPDNALDVELCNTCIGFQEMDSQVPDLSFEDILEVELLLNKSGKTPARYYE